MSLFSSNRGGGGIVSALRIEDVVEEDGNTATFKIATESLGLVKGELSDLQNTVDELAGDIGGVGAVATLSQAVGPVIESVPVIGPDGDEAANLLVTLLEDDVLILRDVTNPARVEKLIVAAPGAPAGATSVPVRPAVATFPAGSTLSLGAGVVLGVVRSYEERIAENESSIETVITRTTTLETDQGALGQRVTEVESIASQTADGFADIVTRTETVEGQVTTASTERQQLADSISDVVTRTEQTEAGLVTAETARQQLADSITDVVTRTETTEAGLVTAGTARQQLADSITDVVTRTEETEAGLTTASTERQQLADSISDVVTRTEQTEAGLVTAETARQQLADSITDVVTRTETTEAGLVTAGTARQQLADSITDVVTRTEETEAGLTTASTERQQLSDSISQKVSKGDEVRSELNQTVDGFAILADRVRSTDYVEGVAGWTINGSTHPTAPGLAEFYRIKARGEFVTSADVVLSHPETRITRVTGGAVQMTRDVDAAFQDQPSVGTLYAGLLAFEAYQNGGVEKAQYGASLMSLSGFGRASQLSYGDLAVGVSASNAADYVLKTVSSGSPGTTLGTFIQKALMLLGAVDQTTDPGVRGQVWNDAGALMISNG